MMKSLTFALCLLPSLALSAESSRPVREERVNRTRLELKDLLRRQCVAGTDDQTLCFPNFDVRDAAQRRCREESEFEIQRSEMPGSFVLRPSSLLETDTRTRFDRYGEAHVSTELGEKDHRHFLLPTGIPGQALDFLILRTDLGRNCASAAIPGMLAKARSIHARIFSRPSHRLSDALQAGDAVEILGTPQAPRLRVTHGETVAFIEMPKEASDEEGDTPASLPGEMDEQQQSQVQQQALQQAQNPVQQQQQQVRNPVQQQQQQQQYGQQRQPYDHQTQPQQQQQGPPQWQYN